MDQKDYFYHSIPSAAPDYIVDQSRKDGWGEFHALVNHRMEVLQAALELVQCPGEDFSCAAQKLFRDEEQRDLTRTEDGRIYLDTLSAPEIADMVRCLLPTCGNQPSRMQWQNAETLVDTAFLTVKEWEYLRTISLGGSDVAVTQGISPYRTAFELYHDKVGTPYQGKKEYGADSTKAFFFEYGHRVEGLVISEFLRRTGAELIPETRMFRSKKFPELTANMDGIVRMPNGDIWLFEAKTTDRWNDAAWDNGNCPPQYIPQCLHYMGVLNDSRVNGTYLCCLFGNKPDNFRGVPISYYADIVDSQMEDTHDWWQSHVLSHVVPAPTDVTAEVYYGYTENYAEGEYCRMPEDAKRLFEEYFTASEAYTAAKANVGVYKERRDGIAMQLAALAGTAQLGFLPTELGDGSYYKVEQKTRAKTVENKQYLEELSKTHPEITSQLKVTTVVPTDPAVKIVKKLPRGITL